MRLKRWRRLMAYALWRASLAVINWQAGRLRRGYRIRDLRWIHDTLAWAGNFIHPGPE